MKKIFVGYFGGNKAVVQAADVNIDKHDIMSLCFGGRYLCSGKKDVVEQGDGFVFVFSDSKNNARALLLEWLTEKRKSLLAELETLDIAISDV